MLIGNIIKFLDNDTALLNNLINFRNKGVSYFETLKIIEIVDDKDIMEGIVEFFDFKFFIMSIVVLK